MKTQTIYRTICYTFSCEINNFRFHGKVIETRYPESKQERPTVRFTITIDGGEVSVTALRLNVQEYAFAIYRQLVRTRYQDEADDYVFTWNCPA